MLKEVKRGRGKGHVTCHRKFCVLNVNISARVKDTDFKFGVCAPMVNPDPVNKKALLSQRQPRDAPNIWVP